MGLALPRDGWIAAAAFTAAQFPLMLVTSGAGPLIGVGALFLAILSVPPMMVAWATGRLRRRF